MFDDYKALLQQETQRPVTLLGRQLIWIVPLIVVLDQASKAWILYGLNLPVLKQVKILPFFSLSMVHNVGISFGLLGSGGLMRWALTLFQLVVAGALAFAVVRVDQKLLGVALGMIAGGAIGNAVDRIRLGSVVDFLDFSGLHFPWVFNVADSAICIGIALLMWHFVRKDTPATQGN